jgi:O-methyltransferase involved in polyketide biosynthesis
MNNVNKTLYIPLYGKSYVSKKGILLHDPKAEEIWAAEGFKIRGKSASKWLAYYMGMRSAVYDRWLKEKMEEDRDAVVLHIGCGMDSRCRRVGTQGHLWFDIDFPEVIEQRQRYYKQTQNYRMLAGNVMDAGILDEIAGESAIVVMEGVSMYIPEAEMKKFMERLSKKFGKVYLLADFYSTFAAKISKVKNPVNDVGVTQVYGIDDPKRIQGEGLTFLREHEMTPERMIDQLKGMEKGIFRRLYGGRFASRLYRLYEYRK